MSVSVIKVEGVTVTCIDDRRCQGGLVQGHTYPVLAYTDKKDPPEIRVTNEKGLDKWYVINRFNLTTETLDMVSTKGESTEPVEHVEEKAEDAKEEVCVDLEFEEAKKKYEGKKIVVINKDMMHDEDITRDKRYDVVEVYRGIYDKQVYICFYDDAGEFRYFIPEWVEVAEDVKEDAEVADLVGKFVVTFMDDIEDVTCGALYKVTRVDAESSLNTLISFKDDAGDERELPLSWFEIKEVEPKKDIVKGVSKMAKKATLRDFLLAQNVPERLINELAYWRKEMGVVDEHVQNRVPRVKNLYIGSEGWTLGIAALLSGNNIILEGAKATGKNVLAENLAFAFGRPQWDASFHINMDASSLVGCDTYRNNEVQFRPGILYETGQYGGFGVLDEINMARSEAVAVLHQALDDRKYLDVPGYDILKFHPATRFIGTMNYGYSGTRELNEALVSRFVVISVKPMSSDDMVKNLKIKFPNATEDCLVQFVGVFNDLQKKAQNAEISTKAVDFRGIISALSMTKLGVEPLTAITSSIINKAFDEYERNIISDTVKTRICESWSSLNVFPVVEDTDALDIDFSSVK